MAIFVAALFLIVPDFSHAQKRKVKTKPNQTKKTKPIISDEPSQEVIDVAINAVKNENCKEPNIECKGYTYPNFFKRCKIGPADKENGLEKMWLIRVTYIRRANANSNWGDVDFPVLVWKQNGKWMGSAKDGPIYNYLGTLPGEPLGGCKPF